MQNLEMVVTERMALAGIYTLHTEILETHVSTYFARSTGRDSQKFSVTVRGRNYALGKWASFPASYGGFDHYTNVVNSCLLQTSQL